MQETAIADATSRRLAVVATAIRSVALTFFFALVTVTAVELITRKSTDATLTFLTTYAQPGWTTCGLFFLALLMGGAMAMIMLGFMWGMYKNTKINWAIMAGGLGLALVALFLSRSQLFVDDEAYMNGMIPHHSIAILTSERADIDDVRVRELADAIIKAQRKEIKEMEWLLDDIDENGEATTEAEAAERPVPDFEGELNPDGEDE